MNDMQRQFEEKLEKARAVYTVRLSSTTYTRLMVLPLGNLFSVGHKINQTVVENGSVIGILENLSELDLCKLRFSACNNTKLRHTLDFILVNLTSLFIEKSIPIAYLLLP